MFNLLRFFRRPRRPRFLQIDYLGGELPWALLEGGEIVGRVQSEALANDLADADIARVMLTDEVAALKGGKP